MDQYSKWYKIKEFPDGKYEINKKGEVRNSKTGQLLKGTVGKDGYLAYVLTIDNKVYRRLAHVLVATQFIPNPNNYPIVNHIDENKSNPCVDNLEWMTHSQNSNHGSAQSRSELRRSKPINEYDIDGKYIRTWKSTKEIYLYYGLPYDRDHRPSYFVKILTNNEKEGEPKRLFANRVFMRYLGETKDIPVTINEAYAIRNDEYRTLMPAENVPMEYLYFPEKTSESAKRVLEEMLAENQFCFSGKQVLALEYAINCIEQVCSKKSKDQEN